MLTESPGPSTSYTREPDECRVVISVPFGLRRHHGARTRPSFNAPDIDVTGTRAESAGRPRCGFDGSGRHGIEGDLLRVRSAWSRGAPAAHVQHDPEVLGAARAAARGCRHPCAVARLPWIRRERRRSQRYPAAAGRTAGDQREMARRHRRGVRLSPCAARRRQDARRRGRRQLRCESGSAGGAASSRGALAGAARRRARPRRPGVHQRTVVAADLRGGRSRRPVRRRREIPGTSSPASGTESMEPRFSVRIPSSRNRWWPGTPTP
jgi:hypothetical protein